MKETPTEKHARETLVAKGFKVERIPRGATRTADYRVIDASSTYLVEVTDREAGDFLSALRRAAVEDGLAEKTRGFGIDSTLDGKIRRKVDQLDQTPIEADFRVLWIAAFHRDWTYLKEILKRTLFGFAKLFGYRQGHEREPMQQFFCFYYHHASFLRLPTLDAVVLATEEAGCMFVNSLSANAAAFRASKFYGIVGNEARLDPSVLPDGVFFVGPGVDRRAPRDRWTYLKERYGVMTTEPVEAEFHGMISLPNAEPT